MKKIIWIDDEHFYHTYDSYVPLFKQKGYELLLKNKPMDFFQDIDAGLIRLDDINCFIIDMSFRSVDVDEFVATEGEAVGKELISKLKSNESPYKDVCMIVYTITKTKEGELFCKSKRIRYLQKRKVYLKEFVKEVIREIEKAK